MEGKRKSLLVDILEHVTPEILEREGYRRRVSASECLVIAHVHVLPSVVPLFKQLSQFGFRSDAIIIVPKSYSTIRDAQRDLRNLGCEVIDDKCGDFDPGRYDQAAQRMLRKACQRALTRFEEGPYRRCVLIDDGGLLTLEWSLQSRGRYQSISVQQTASGFARPLTHLIADQPDGAEARASESSRARYVPIRRIDVARSAAKRFFEARIIAAGVFEKVKLLHVLRDMRSVGVVGVGYVGRQIACELRRKGKTVYTYDKNPNRRVKGCLPVGHWSECMERADFIFGCTGRDFMRDGLRWLGEVGPKHLVSLSSRDVEFQELLRQGAPIEKHGKFGLIKVSYRNAGPFLVMNGGFPINFDREAEWETDEAISLTRALVLVGVLQSLYLDAEVPNTAIEKLSLLSQNVLMRTWLQRRDKACEDYDVSRGEFEDKSWWYRNSGGSEYKGNWMDAAPSMSGRGGL